MVMMMMMMMNMGAFRHMSIVYYKINIPKISDHLFNYKLCEKTLDLL